MSSGLAWYLLRVRTAFERVVHDKLSADGLEIFLPWCHQRSPGRKSSETPLFPSYVFCRMSSDVSTRVLLTPGVLCVSGTHRLPAVVDEMEMAALKSVVRSGLYYEASPFVSSGLKVKVASGPLRDFEGILIEFESDCRIAFGVSALRRSVLTELSGGTQIIRAEAQAIG